MERAGVLVIEGHRILRDITCERVLQDPLLCVVGEARDAPEAAEMIARRWPDLVLVDLDLPDGKALALTRHLAQTRPALTVILIGDEAAPEYVSLAYRCGAAGYVIRQQGAQQLLTVIHRALASAPPPRWHCGVLPNRPGTP